MSEPILFVPPHWPMLWDQGDDVRLACPNCGQMHAYLRRPPGGTPTLACTACETSGIAVFQRAFDKITGRKTPPQIKKAQTA